MYRLITILGIILVVSCQSGDKANRKSDKIGNEVVMVEDTLNISGMHCDMCVASIEKGINELDGIEYVKAILNDSITIVRFNSSKTKLSEIERAVEKRGYKVKSD